MRSIKLDSGRLRIFIGRISLEAYWPVIFLGQNNAYGFSAKTVVLWQPKGGWKWDWALAVMFLGFGSGISANHVDNPNHATKPEVG